MLDQHSGIHFTETSSQETSPTPTDMSIPPQILISAAPLSAFPDSLSLVCLPTYQVTFPLLLASPTTINSSSPLSCASTGLHPSLSPLALGWMWCPLSALGAWGQEFFSRAHHARTWPPSKSDNKH